MAQAKRDVTTIFTKKVVDVAEEVATITLTLTQEEADLLRGVLGNLRGGGDWNAGPKTRARREMSDGIWDALYKAGAQNIGNPFEGTPELRNLDEEVPF